MNLLICSQYFHPERFLINDIALELKKTGINVTVLTGLPNYPQGKIYKGYLRLLPKTESWNGIKIIRIPIISRGNGSAIRLTLNYLSFIFSALIFLPFLLIKIKADSIFVFGTSPIIQALPAILLSKFKKSPVTLWVQDLWPDSLEFTGHISNKYALKVITCVTKFIYKNSHKILVSSPSMIEGVKNVIGNNKIVKHFPNLMRGSVNSCIDLSNLSEKMIKSLAKMSEVFSVFFAGNIGRAQSWETIIDAASICASNSDINFFIAGTGTEHAACSEKIKSLNLNNVFMLGDISGDCIDEFYQKASVLLITLGKHKALGRTIPSKIQAYLKAGKPILCAADGDASAIVSEIPAGLSCKAECAESLAQLIKQFYCMDKDELLVFGENGKKYFLNNFCLEDNIYRLVEELSGN